MINLEQSIKVVENAMELANSKGAFTLQEAATVFSAVGVVKRCVEESMRREEAQKMTTDQPDVEKSESVKPAPTKKTIKKTTKK